MLQNKNYELPNPPIQYTFSSAPDDPMLAVNMSHAYLIRRMYTNLKGDDVSFLADKDLKLLEDSLKDRVDSVILEGIEIESKKYIQTIILHPEYWLTWLNLFDDENIYEETMPNEDGKKNNQSINQSIKEISSVRQLSHQQQMFQEGVFGKSSRLQGKQDWGIFLIKIGQLITENLEMEEESFRDKPIQIEEIPDSFEEDPKETIRRQMIDYRLNQLEKETDVNVLTQRENLETISAMPDIGTPQIQNRTPKHKSSSRPVNNAYGSRPTTAR